MGVVLFDMDHTLVDMNTFWALGRTLARRGILRGRVLAAMAIDQLLYGLRVRSLDDVMTHAHGLVTGHDAAFMGALVDALVEDEIAPKIFPAARQRIEEHRARADRVVIASASPDFLVRRVAALVGVTEWIATRHRVVNGTFAGLELPGAWGPGKVEHARRAGLLEEKPHVYTDHPGDFALVAAAGFATLVNPPPALIRMARRIPHEVVQWSSQPPPSKATSQERR